jgi:Heparinase II/III-like protein/Heparinase II/III N-terminus
MPTRHLLRARTPARSGWASPLVTLAASGLLWLAVGAWALWWPVVAHYRIDTPAIDPAVIAAHRSAPSDEVLTVVADASMVTDHPLRGADAVAAARRILAGELALPKLPVLPVGADFQVADLDREPPVQKLWAASLIVPDLLLRAYEDTPDPAFFAAAKRYLRGFIEHERGRWLESGWTWNGHATTNRVAVLARYWKFARRIDAGDTDMAALVHEHAARLAARLAKPTLFVANTNYGLMQNLGLVELAAAFPSLPQAAERRALALQRTQRQLPFYMSDEGIVLEHSPGYHFHGVLATGFLVRVLQASGQTVPAALQRAHDKSLDFMAQLQRPDRSMPLLGNTFRYQWRLPQLLGVDDAAWEKNLKQRASFAALHPVAGYSVVWDRGAAGTGTHSVVSWGRFMGHGHQRAQEMSLAVWAAGTDWSTNTGYWPGDDPHGEELAKGWDGGNAPHLLGETPAGKRHTRLLGQVDAPGLRLLDLERAVDGGPSLRRQILQVDGDAWIVLDTVADGGNRPLRVLWTAAPETELRVDGARAFSLRREGQDLGMSLAFDGPAAASATPLRGSLAPFGGWVAFDRRAVPAPAVDARLQPGGGWMLTRLQLAPAAALASLLPPAANFASAEDWEATLQRPEGPLRLQRRGSELIATTVAGAQRLALLPGPEVSAAQDTIAASMQSLLTQYPRFREALAERREASVLMAALAVLLLAGALAATRLAPQRGIAAWSGAHLLWFAALAIVVLLRLPR